MLARGLLLPGPRRHADRGLLALRLATGVFLVYGTWDTVSDAARMRAFAVFQERFGFPAPGLMAPLSAWAQFLCGGLFVAGLFTRWAGWIMAFNFVVAIAMVDRLSPAGFRGVWPALALVAISLHLGLRGAGALSVDRALERRWLRWP